MLAEAQIEQSPSRDRHSLGIWVEQENSHDDMHAQTTSSGDDHGNLVSASFNAYTAGDQAEYTPLLPDQDNQVALFEIYFSRFHPLLPILDEKQFRKDLAGGVLSPALAQAVCLVMSRDIRAKAYLMLPELSSTVLRPLQFSSSIYSSLKRSIVTRRERDNICLIQVLALLSLYTDSGPYGVENASMHLAQAVHHAQTIGLHLGRSKGHRQSYDRLFWCLWCLSIFNAASNGRPRLMDDHDIGLKLEDTIEVCHPAFRIFGTLSRLLVRVIQLYQPTSDPGCTGVDHNFPSFETITQKNNGWEIEVPMLTSLELFYHAISILSYRTRSTDDVELAEPSLSSLRQSLSAQQVMRILNHTPMEMLLTFPMVPYAVSLALSQTYRQFRRSRSVMKRAIALEQLECYVHALENMSDHFRSALTLGTIGRKALSQIQHLNKAVARQAAEALPPQVPEASYRQNADTSSVNSAMLETAGTAFGNDQDEILYSLDSFGDFDGLFSEDGTLQAMDTVFDNFMGLDLPNELFNASFEAAIPEPGPVARN